MCQPIDAFNRPGQLNFIGSSLMPIPVFACKQDEVRTLALLPVLSCSNSISSNTIDQFSNCDPTQWRQA